MPHKTYPLVFVYGTLKRGFHNHCVMEQAGGEFVCKGTTVECYPLVVKGLPYLLRIPGEGYQVEGEIYRVASAEGWKALDRLEGHPKFYERRVVDIAGENGEIYAAWVYFLAAADQQLASLPSVRAYGKTEGVVTR